MYLIAFAHVVSEDTSSEHTVGLTVVIASPVEIVQQEAHATVGVDVCREVATHAVLSVGAVAHFVIGQIGQRTFAVGEAEIRHTTNEIVVALQEEQFVGIGTVEIDAREAWRAGVAQHLVFAAEAVRQVPPLEIVDCGVRILCRQAVAQQRVNGPLAYALGCGRFFCAFLAPPTFGAWVAVFVGAADGAEGTLSFGPWQAEIILRLHAQCHAGEQ